jgi:hypothetical protein
MTGERHGRGMLCVNRPLAARHGRGTAWARHAMCESALTVSGTAQTTNNKFENSTTLRSLFQKDSMDLSAS